MNKLIDFLTEEEPLPFVPGVYTKCKRAIKSCNNKEHLAIANRLLENNKDKLTDLQYSTLKQSIVTKALAVGLVLLDIETPNTYLIKIKTLLILSAFGVLCWLSLAFLIKA